MSLVLLGVLLCSIVVLVVFFVPRGSNEFSAASVCYSGERSGGVELALPVGRYEVLVRYTAQQNSLADLSARVDVAMDDGRCALAQVFRAGMMWHRVGEVTSRESSTVAIISGGVDIEQPYGFLQIMFRPTDSTVVCSGRSDCVGTTGEVIRPSLSFDNMYQVSASRLVDPDDDRITSVDVYSGSAFVLSRARPLDDQIVEPQQQIVNYASGQIGVVQQRGGAVRQTNIILDILMAGWSIVLLGVIIIGLIVGFVYGLARWRGGKHYRDNRDEYLAESYWLKEVRQRISKTVILSAVGVVLLVIVIITARLYVIDTTRITGSSMEPTFSDGTRTYINKLPITVRTMMHIDEGIERGEYVFIRQQSLVPSAPGNQHIFKRAVGLPGDTVRFLGDEMDVVDQFGVVVYSDRVIDSASLIPADDPPAQFVVPAGTVYVLGDNRPSSVDSRTFGPVSMNTIVGVQSSRASGGVAE